MVPSPQWLPFERLALVVAAGLSFLLVWRMAQPGGRWGHRLRSRLLLGLPWGSLAAALGVLSVYLFVQGGLDHWRSPLVVPFRAWSYFYPTGMVLAPFAHAGTGHLLGNLIGAVTIGPLAEYAWSHFPTERGTTSFGSLRTNPFARVLAFVAAMVAVGLASSLFGLGPVIGFSSVLFALAGFALVRYPLATIVVLAARGVIKLVYDALRNPVAFAEAGPGFVSPGFAEVALQGHALGLLVGLTVGAFVFRRRDAQPPALRVWFGVLVFAVGQSLWQVYFFQGEGTYVLFRALGAALVFVLAGLAAAAVAAPDRRVLPRVDVRFDETVLAVLFVVTLVTGAVAVPWNMTAVTAGDPPGRGEHLSVRGYTVTYAEDVPDRLVRVIDVSGFGQTTQINTSGVIVVNEDRSIWWTAVSKSRLGFRGYSELRVGGVGWRETVIANRTGWTVGRETTYKVYLRAEGEPGRLAYASGPATSDAVIDGRNVSIAPTETGFEVLVSQEGARLDTAPVPSLNRSVTVGGLTLEREGRYLVARRDNTSVPVAHVESYN